MRRVLALMLLCLLGGPAAAQADDAALRAAVTNLWLALKTCLDHAAAPQDVYGAMQQAGFNVTPIHAGGVAEISAFGVRGAIAPSPDPSIGRTYCSLSSSMVPLAVAEASMLAGAQAAYPGAQVSPSARLYRAGCHHMRITLDGVRHEIAFASRNNDGTCGDGQSTEIVF